MDSFSLVGRSWVEGVWELIMGRRSLGPAHRSPVSIAGVEKTTSSMGYHLPPEGSWHRPPFTTS